MVDDNTGTVLNSQTLSGFQNGVYLVWNLTGSVTVRVTNLNPSSNAVVSGLFFGAGTSVHTPPTLPVVVDDVTSGYSETGPGWQTWLDGYNGELRYVAPGTGGSAASWQVTGLTPGSYAVQTTWLASSTHATNATYQIFDGATLVQSMT